MKKSSWFLVFILVVSIINYPNPFNPANNEITTIECTSDTTTEAFIYIYDLAARLLTRKSLALQAGITNRTSWNGYSTRNQLAGNGIYLYQIITRSGNRLGKGKIWISNQ